MISKGIFVLLLVSVILVSGCVNNPPAPSSNDKQSDKPNTDLVLDQCEPLVGNPNTDLSKTHEEDALTLNYPSDWSKITYLGSSHFVPAGEDEGGNTVVLNIQTEDTDKSLDKYSSDNLDSIKSDPDVAGVKICSTTFGGSQARKLVFSHFGYDKQYLHVWTIKDNKVYTISFGAPVDSFSGYLPDVESIIDTASIA